MNYKASQRKAAIARSTYVSRAPVNGHIPSMAVYSSVSFQEMFPVSLLHPSAMLIYGGRCVYNGLS